MKQLTHQRIHQKTHNEIFPQLNHTKSGVLEWILKLLIALIHTNKEDVA